MAHVAGLADKALSAREIELLTLVGRGLSNTEIAGRLFIATSTVKAHLDRIAVKLGTRRRVAMVVEGLRRAAFTLEDLAVTASARS